MTSAKRTKQGRRATAVSYSERLQDDRWKRVSRQERDLWPYCRACGKELPNRQTHHGYYRQGLHPWSYPRGSLWVLCDHCHGIADRFRETCVELLGFVHPHDWNEVLGFLRARRDRARVRTDQEKDDLKARRAGTTAQAHDGLVAARPAASR